MRNFDAGFILFWFLTIGGIGFFIFLWGTLAGNTIFWSIGGLLIFGASCIVLYGWLDMTAEIRDNLVELNTRLAEKESNEEMED
jgi:hypothetical protein